MAEKRTPYDAIPYHSQPFPQTRPERLAAVAKIFGLDAPPIERCRVLELGCASGGNLIAMAQDFPGSRFIGIDASARQIADGWKVIDALGLENIDIKHMDILDVDDQFGAFDYIISHGVFSWVPPAVQERMIEICRRNLVANGVAYISYNTYPGWHIRGIVRDMMHYHGTQFAHAPAQLAQAKALVEFVVNSLRGENNPYKLLLKGEFERITTQQDAYLHHEHLEENNQPLYFHEFARRLAVNGLQYVGEAEFSTMVSTNFGPQVAETLNRIGAHDIVQMEQYMDYVRCRFFRQTLLCRSAVRLNRLIEPEVVKNFWLASQAVPVQPESSTAPTGAVEFRTPAGVGINCRHPLTKIAMRRLAGEWPAPVAFANLFADCKAEAVRQGIPFEEAGSENFLASDLLACMAVGVMEWRLTPVGFTTVPGVRPATTPLARLQATEGTMVTNLRGESIDLDEIHRHVLRHLDGTRDLVQLTETIVAFLNEGGHTLRRDEDNSPVTGEVEMRRLLGPALEKTLRNLAKNALLVVSDRSRSRETGTGVDCRE